MVGKNRMVDAVIGEGHKPTSGPGGLVSTAGHTPMAGAEPEPADPAEIVPLREAIESYEPRLPADTAVRYNDLAPFLAP